MKLFGALCLCLLCPGASSAQGVPDNSTPPEVLILNYNRSFKMERYLPHNWENLPESYPRRSYPPPSTSDGVYTGWPSTEAPMKRTKLRPLFVYSMEVKNNGAKKITEVVWEYVIIGRGNDKELARLQFRNRARIVVNGTAILNGKSVEPPRLPKVINVQEIEKEGDTPYRERVEIKCVLYADESWWRHPKAMESDCESLVRGKKSKGR